MTTDFTALGVTGRGAGDQVIYWRRPMVSMFSTMPADNPGWITWGDSLSGTKLRDYLSRGFTPLMQYGVINSKENAERFRADGNGRQIWGLILSHAMGPAEFPVNQVLTFGWYRPERCPLAGVFFPQLIGRKVREYQCPECNRPAFVDLDDAPAVRRLAIHLRLIHKWERLDLMAYGERLGIDFNEAVGGLVTDYEVAGVGATPADVNEVARPSIEVETVVAPAFGCNFPGCGKAFTTRIALAGHKRSHAKAVVGSSA